MNAGEGVPTGPGSSRVGNWGRWGPEDERGALNLITEEVVAGALRLPQRGRVIPLGTEVGKKGPITGGRNATWHLTVTVAHPTDPGRGRAEDVLNLHTHAHSHMDGLGHVWTDGQLYNGFPSSTVGRGGAGRLSISRAGGVVTRGVLLDVTGAGDRRWEIGELITVEDLETAGRAGRVDVRAGDAVMIRTGWYDRFLDGDPVFHAGEPGLGREAADWLASRDVALVGMDNSALEPIPARPGANPLYVHETFLRDHGIFMLELLDLSGLAESGAPEFLFVAAPLRIDRGLGSPVNPLAVI